MSLYLRFFGGGLVLLSALAASSEYSSYAERRLAQYSGLLALLSHAEGMISRFLSSGDGLWRGFENEELEKIGLLPLLREGKTLSKAFLECEGRFVLSKEAKERIKDFLSTSGRGYMEGEVAAFSGFRAQLDTEMKAEKERLEKNVKVTRALLLGGALAFLILII